MLITRIICTDLKIHQLNLCVGRFMAEIHSSKTHCLPGMYVRYMQKIKRYSSHDFQLKKTDQSIILHFLLFPSVSIKLPRRRQPNEPLLLTNLEVNSKPLSYTMSSFQGSMKALLHQAVSLRKSLWCICQGQRLGKCQLFTTHGILFYFSSSHFLEHFILLLTKECSYIYGANTQ